MKDKKLCKLRECPKEFTPKYPNQKYCCPIHGNRDRVRKHYGKNRKKILADKKATREA